MDKNRVIVLLFSIILIILLVITFILGRKSVDIPEIKTETKIDTTYIEKPVPYKVETVETKYVYLPSEPSPPDTVYIDREVIKVDSVKVAIDIERKVYQDSTFKATISGPRIGKYGPNLDDINIYSRTETKIIEKPYPFLVPYISFGGGKDILGIGGGVTIKQRVDIGAKYLRVQEHNMFLVEANIRFNK
jgi:hypothetical protein